MAAEAQRRRTSPPSDVTGSVQDRGFSPIPFTDAGLPAPAVVGRGGGGAGPGRWSAAPSRRSWRRCPRSAGAGGRAPARHPGRVAGGAGHPRFRHGLRARSVAAATCGRGSLIRSGRGPACPRATVGTRWAGAEVAPDGRGRRARRCRVAGDDLAWDRVDPFAGQVHDGWAWLCLVCHLYAVPWPPLLAALAVGRLRRS